MCGLVGADSVEVNWVEHAMAKEGNELTGAA
jgi:hypothetical protein